MQTKYRFYGVLILVWVGFFNKEINARTTRSKTRTQVAPKKTTVAAKDTNKDFLLLRSEAVLIKEVDSQKILLNKNATDQKPIASVTKMISALVLLKDEQPLKDIWKNNTQIKIAEEDKDTLKNSHSKLRVGSVLSADLLFLAALGASDNRAIFSLVRNLGYDREDFVKKMNMVAQSLGMNHSHFADPAGLDPSNLSTAQDLLKLLDIAAQYPQICNATTQEEIELFLANKNHTLTLKNPNRLAKHKEWGLVVGKTGYTKEAGRTFIARVKLFDKTIDMVFLGAHEKASVFGDAQRIKKWLAPMYACNACNHYASKQ